MKYNKWTVGLLAIGAVSFASVVRAEEASSLASVSSTVLSGYVDTSAQWNLGTGDSHTPAYKYNGAGKADGFNLDVVKLSLEKPLDEADWAAGYKVDLFIGPDANVLGTASTGIGSSSDFAIKQAYVALRAPVGNGLDFKVGVWDSIIGYESTEAVNNPNFSRSWGHTFEPSTETGVLATYRFSKEVAVSAGVADTANSIAPAINGRSGNESYKAYMASAALTAPDDWGFISGSTLYAGIINGINTLDAEPQTSYYLGMTIATPVTGLRFGASFDYAQDRPKNGLQGFGAHSFAAYSSYQYTEKLSFHGRIEYADLSATAAGIAQGEGIAAAGIAPGAGLTAIGGGIPSSVLALTGTVQYDLWKNVLSRLELRWDHDLNGVDSFGGTQAGRLQGGHYTTGTAVNSWSLAANIIYKF